MGIRFVNSCTKLKYRRTQTRLGQSLDEKRKFRSKKTKVGEQCLQQFRTSFGLTDCPTTRRNRKNNLVYETISRNSFLLVDTYTYVRLNDLFFTHRPARVEKRPSCTTQQFEQVNNTVTGRRHNKNRLRRVNKSAPKWGRGPPSKSFKRIHACFRIFSAN